MSHQWLALVDIKRHGIGIKPRLEQGVSLPSKIKN